MTSFPFASRYAAGICFLHIAILSIFLNSCARPPYPSGKWLSSRKVAAAFEQAQVFRDHSYYYVGSIARPDGIIAIDNRYRLHDSNVWAQADVDESVLREWQHWWRADTFHHCRFLGGVILTPDGRRAGYWYSPFRNNVVQMPEEGVLLIHQPHSITGATDCEDGGQNNMNLFRMH